MKGKGKNKKSLGYKCVVKKIQVEWYVNIPFFGKALAIDVNVCRLAMNALKKVMGKKQSKFGKVIEWLDEEIEILRAREQETCRRMTGIVESISD